MCKCYFCGVTATLDDAIDAGWEPSFFVGDDQETDQACPRCSARYLQIAEDGEMELKPGQFEGQGVT